MHQPDTSGELGKANRAGTAWQLRRCAVRFAGLVLLGVTIGLIYWPATRAPFFFDDSGTIVDNPTIRQLWPLVGNAANPGPLKPPQATPIDGRPLVNLSLALNYRWGGLDPFGYRVLHMAIHFISAALLWAIVARTLRLDFFRGQFDRSAAGLSCAAALVWALHPVNSECLVYITQRTELMMGMFYLATLYFSQRYWAATGTAIRTSWLLCALLAGWAGVLCKEMMVTAPVMILLFERTFVTGSFRQAIRRSWPLYLGLVLGWIHFIALFYHGARTPGAGFGQGLAAPVWWLTQARAVLLYGKLAFWPWPLVIHYEIPYLRTLAEAWPWLVPAALLAVISWVLLYRRWSIGYAGTWFFVVLSPTLVIPLVGETAVERRLYVPLAALVPLMIVGGYVMLRWCWQFLASRTGVGWFRHGAAPAFGVATLALAAGWGYLCSCRLEAYRDELALWQDAVLHQPHDPLVQFNLGTMLAEAGRLPAAIRHFEESARLDPESYRAHYNLARAFEASARPRKAIGHYRASLRLHPDDAPSHYNLARLLEERGLEREAIKHYQQTIAVEPDFAAAHTNVAILLLTIGQVEQGIEHLETALQLQEDLTNYMNLVLIYSQLNRVSAAIAVAERALAFARSQGETSQAAELEAALTFLRGEVPPR